MEEATLTSGANGVAPTNARESIAAQLEAEIERARERRDVLASELAELNGDIKAFEQSLLRLRGEPLINHPGSRGRTKKGVVERVRDKPAGIGPDRLDAIKQAIYTYSLDHDEFRQVDIRATGVDDSSGRMANAFEVLRQQSLIRFSRKDGLSKCFRLTPEGMRERDEAVDAI